MTAQRLSRLVEQHCGPWRERLYGPLMTLALFIEQVMNPDQSCQDAVCRAACARVAQGQARASLNTGPYCKARRRLSLSLIETLGKEIGRDLCTNQPRSWLWRGRHLKLIDGTTVTMPDTSANQREFPQHGEQAPGVGFPIARLLAVVSLSNGAVLQWASGPCEGAGSGEAAMLWSLSSQFSPGDVAIADRGLSSYFMLARWRQLAVDFVVRQNGSRHTDFRRGRRLGARDHLVHWARPARPVWMDEATYEQMPKSMEVRELRSGNWTIVTSMLNRRGAPKREVVELYRARWNIELDLRAIKSVMQMDMLRCRTPAMIAKEIAVHLLAYNLVRTLMAQAAAASKQVQPRQLSFKTALQLICAFHDLLRRCPRTRQVLMRAHVLGGIACARLPHRPRRSEPREVKRRRSSYKNLTQPRAELRPALLKRQLHFISMAQR